MSKENFEPVIVGFLCNWCSYAGADLAGVSRIQYPPNLRPIRVMCSGRVEPSFVLKAFQEGADGVLISGCHIGDCHYVDGNVKTLRRTPLTIKLLEQLGIEEERFMQTWVSAAEGEKFANVIDEMVTNIKKVGPYQKKTGNNIDALAEEVLSITEAAATEEGQCKGGHNHG
ncbi:F420-non-reducing hydrogenase subunit D [Desulfonispora thiosulfatigenes DSM 11270]|uniref:F420-non-reducing hydrogenase subunit D n=1 Tax=Desulfonispora thiosulfatigenes DSM 11270 TaxID=656914 RepID=A0A1W1VSX0_DESTI|nr:F420-non-reducing hydrogenase subunit D [Desulfonispora thiosulfatigenes DSM 11270]